MESNILERIRLREEDIENNIDSIVQQMLIKEDIDNRRHSLLIDHFIASKIKEITVLADELADLYLDEDDIVQLRSQPSDGSRDTLVTALRKYESRVADLRERRTALSGSAPSVKHELAQPSVSLLDHVFTPEEIYGRSFFLRDNFNLYIAFIQKVRLMGKKASKDRNVSGSAPASFESFLQQEIQKWYSSRWESFRVLEYFDFVSQLSSLYLRDIPASMKIFGFSWYRQWLEGLLKYLSEFYDRIYPLEHSKLLQQMTDVECKAEQYWNKVLEEGEIPWDDEPAVESRDPAIRGRINAKKSSGLLIPASLYKSMEHFSIWPIAYVRQLLHSVANEGESKENAHLVNQLPQSEEDVKKMCIVEGKIEVLLKTLLFEAYEGTISYLKRTLSKTMEELEREKSENDELFLASFNAAKKKMYNTVEGTIAQAAQYSLGATEDVSKSMMENYETEDGTGEAANKLVPLGEDGNPVPHWLVKLQQLDKVFYCEVCGNTMYRGPKIYREHFGRDRHAEGLRRLGVVEHLKAFEGISTVKEVVALRDQLGKSVLSVRKRLDREKNLEEMEDHSGVVIRREYYQRQQFN